MNQDDLIAKKRTVQTPEIAAIKSVVSVLSESKVLTFAVDISSESGVKRSVESRSDVTVPRVVNSSTGISAIVSAIIF